MKLNRLSVFAVGLLWITAAQADLLDVVVKGTTDYSVTLKIIDSTDGTPETAVVFNTAGIDLWYRREGAVSVDLTENALTTPALTDAHEDDAILHINDGYYRVDLPDAAVASGADWVDVGGTVTGMIVLGGRVRLTGINVDDAVRAGMTALPNAAADAAGGLPISDAGGLDLDAILADTADMQPKLGTFTDFGSGTSTLAANLQDLADDGTAVYSRATDSLQAIRDRGDAAWVTGGGGACTADVGCIADGTAAAVTATTIDLDAAETFADSELVGGTVVIASATAGAGQSRVITANTAANDRLTVDTWTTTPTGTITYRVFSTPPGSTTSPAPVNVLQMNGTAQTAGDVIGDTNDIQARLPAALVNSRMDATVDGAGLEAGAIAALQQTALDTSIAGSIGQRIGRIPNAAAGGTGGLPTVDASNLIVGIQANGINAAAIADNAIDLATFATDVQFQALLDANFLLSGTADSGTSSTIVDAALTQADADWWAGGVGVRFTSGTLAGQVACAIDFNAGTDTITFYPAATAAVAAHTYLLLPAPSCSEVIVNKVPIDVGDGAATPFNVQ